MILHASHSAETLEVPKPGFSNLVFKIAMQRRSSELIRFRPRLQRPRWGIGGTPTPENIYKVDILCTS